MSRYVLIETRDPFASSGVEDYVALATGLAAQGKDVIVFLVENGVLGSRAAIPNNPLAALTSSEVTVLADGFSLKERGITTDEVIDGIKSSDINDFVDIIMDEAGTKVVWH